MQISSFVAVLFSLVFCLTTKAEETKPLEKLSVEQKVGQTMIWTFGGTEFNAQTEDLLSKYPIGAFIAFSRNIKSTSQIATFNARAQKFAKKKLPAPLFMMIDQEGGTVTRVRVATPIPSALALGRMHNAQFAEDFAKTKAEMLLALGFNVNLSPVMDISSPAQDTFIGNRVFGDNPDDVKEISMAYARGLAAAGMMPTAKHFPGHGGMVNDTHLKAATKMSTWEELEQRDLVPFIEYMDGGFTKALMMAHMALPNVDPSGQPATYSSIIIRDHLRDKLGYKGLVITDDLEMGGASVSGEIGERAVRAFLAGNDMLMFAGPPKNQRKAFEAMVAAVKSKRISQERLDESVARILAAKAALKPPGVKYEPAKSKELKDKLEALSREVMKKNFKDALDSKTSLNWPTMSKDSRVTVLAADPRFYRHFEAAFPGKTRFHYLSPDTIADAKAAIANPKSQFTIFYASGSQTAKWLAKLSPELRAKVIVVNCNNEGQVADQDSFFTVFNINSHSPEAGGWLAEALIAPPEIRQPAAKEEPSGDQSAAVPRKQRKLKPRGKRADASQFLNPFTLV